MYEDCEIFIKLLQKNPDLNIKNKFDQTFVEFY